MKNVLILKIILLLLFVSCSTNDDGNNQQNLANRPSSCNNANGYTGVYWDMVNTRPTGLSSVFVIPGPTKIYQHPFPALSFEIPSNFVGHTIPGSGVIGVDIIRNDNAVLYRYLPNALIPGAIPSSNIILDQVNSVLLPFYGFNGAPELLCETNQSTVFEGLPIEFRARMFRFNGVIGVVWVRTIFVAGSTGISISIASAPENEFENQVTNTFLPFIFQLYVNDGGNIIDNDNDGFTVLEDPDDNDPDVPVKR